MNVALGFVNLVVAYFPLVRVGAFDIRDTAHVAALGLGIFLLGFLIGDRFNSGNKPTG